MDRDDDDDDDEVEDGAAVVVVVVGAVIVVDASTATAAATAATATTKRIPDRRSVGADAWIITNLGKQMMRYWNGTISTVSDESRKQLGRESVFA